MAHRTDINAIPDAFTNFDSSPDSAHIRLPVVQRLYGCSAATIWRMVKRGSIPAPKKLSTRVTAWNIGEIRAALGITSQSCMKDAA